MELPKDPMLLLSVINTKLRDFYPDLDSLCEDMGADKDAIIETLGAFDYTYEQTSNQFV